MAWIEPKTDWSDSDICTYADLNRIGANINELGGEVKADFAAFEFGTLDWWQNVTNTLRLILLANGVQRSFTDEADYNSLNAVEEGLEIAKEQIELRLAQKVATNYCGELFSGADYYMGGY